MKVGQDLVAMFALVKSVTQKAYPWFPKGDELQAEIDSAFNNWIVKKG